MPHFFDIKEEASLEIIEAYSYYENKQKGLGERFFKRIEDTYRKIDLSPEGYQKVHKLFRAAKVKNFPYQLIYEVAGKTILIYSLFNTHKDPAKKYRNI
jgi:hypothetical protein